MTEKYINHKEIFMCGIVGYVGKRNASEILIEGLKALEYRGYDSAGISIIVKDKLKTIKSVGKICELEKLTNNLEYSNMGIGHTRWATHGGVTLENAHPHSVGKVTLVHNGIIENYRELKNELNYKDYKSETDSEVAAALINECFTNDPIKAISEATKRIKGSYALLIMFEGINKLYAVRKGNPLIIGLGKEENFVASDITAILKYTKKYYEMNELEIFEISANKVKIYNKNIDLITKKAKEAEWNIEASQKNGYEYFMLKEINEQPSLIEKVKAKYLNNSNFIDVLDLNKYKKIDIVACGSAYHAGLIGKSLFDKYNVNDKIEMNIDVASEYRYKTHSYKKKTLVIVISQSGETADTLASLRLAKDNKVDTLAIVNVISSSIAKGAKYVMPMLAGPEIAVATTKGYFTQVLLLSFLMLNYYQNSIDLNKYLKELNDLCNKVTKVINNNEYEKLAKEVYKNEDIYFIGRGIDYSLCLEASLKLKEISYIHSDAYPAGELKHGPIALIENNTPVFVLITDDKLKDKTLSNAIEAKARGAKLYLILKDGINVDKSLFTNIIIIPATLDFYQPLINIIPFQLIAFYIAKLRNCDIDKPKNLAKSVTVE
jgi:glucosamine--fructose-6-phosphate aminotransferase (isomerizing)